MKTNTAKVSFPKKGVLLDSEQQLLGTKCSEFQGEKFQKEGPLRNRKDSQGNPNHSTEFHPNFVGRMISQVSGMFQFATSLDGTTETTRGSGFA